LKGDEFRVKSFYGDDEKALLESFAELLSTHYRPPRKFLCAHNGKEFDFPYLARRMIICGIRLPDILNLHGKKPWEVTHLDTMELWKFGDYKNYTSLDLLATILDIPTPKDDIDGSDVWRIYWEEKDLERIRNYCQKDTLTVAQILMRYLGRDLIGEDQMVIT
jgi:DNA polymerase elongation subunit (family B)